MKKLMGESELNPPETDCPTVALKLYVQNSHGWSVPVVERTVKGPLTTVWLFVGEVETMLPIVTVLVYN